MARLLLRLSLVALSLALALTVALQARLPREVVEVLALPDEVLGLAVAQAPAQPAAQVTGQPTAVLPTATVPAPTAAPTPSGEPSTVVLQQGRDGYAGNIDTFIQFYAPEENYCHSAELFVVTTDKAVAFLRFDLTGLPTATAVANATLELYAVQGNQGAEIGLYLPLKEWDACGITWTRPWQQPGANGAGDRQAEPLQVIKSGPAPEWLLFDVTGAVRQWLQDPSTNHGLMVKSLETTVPSQHILFSSENADSERRPRLTIRYQPPQPTPEATSPSLPSETPAPTPVPPVDTPAPAVTPAATPTAITPGSPRVIELHWWKPMEVGGTYPVTLVFRPEKPGPGSSEFDTYVLAANAQLNAATFDTSAASEQLQILTRPESSLVWRWTVQPRSAGERTLAFEVDLSWTPAVPDQPPVRTDPGIWQQSRTAKVNAAFAYWPAVRMARLALIGAGLLFWLGWLVLHQRRQQL